MYSLIIIIHVIVCFILIATILLHAGKGGGLSELLGGASSQTIFGARASTFLTRATTAAAVLFLLTCISLTIFSSKRVKSLMTGVQQPEIVEQEPEIVQELVPPEPEASPK